MSALLLLHRLLLHVPREVAGMVGMRVVLEGRGGWQERLG